MARIPYVLTRLVGPFMVGVLVAAAAATDAPALAAILLVLAAGFALLSLPATGRVVRRALAELDQLIAWPAE